MRFRMLLILVLALSLFGLSAAALPVRSAAVCAPPAKLIPGKANGWLVGIGQAFITYSGRQKVLNIPVWVSNTSPSTRLFSFEHQLPMEDEPSGAFFSHLTGIPAVTLPSGSAACATLTFLHRSRAGPPQCPFVNGYLLLYPTDTATKPAYGWWLVWPCR
jgi:hypothetical protein